jgi:hypothetical protein
MADDPKQAREDFIARQAMGRLSSTKRNSFNGTLFSK